MTTFAGASVDLQYHLLNALDFTILMLIELATTTITRLLVRLAAE